MGKSIFDSGELFAMYRIRLEFRARVLAGIPKDPAVIMAWIAKKLGVSDGDELRAFAERTLREQGLPIPAGADIATMRRIAEEFGDIKHTNGFKRDARGIYLEGRQVKAMFKEGCNILYPYQQEKWGPTKKAPRSYFAERVFVRDLRIHLLRDGLPLQQADGTEQVIGHISDAQGPRSTLTDYEYADEPELAFTIYSMQDCITYEQWKMLLLHGQENGLGAVRSQSFGTFDVLEFRKLAPGELDADAGNVYVPDAAPVAADK